MQANNSAKHQQINNNSHKRCINQSKQSYIPFMYKSKRSFPPIGNKQIPALGTYNLRSCFDKYNRFSSLEEHRINLAQVLFKKQMPMFKSKSQRFKDRVGIAPGPNSYNLIPQTKNRNKHIKNSASLGNLKNISLSRCPSIPGILVKYGYSIDQNGKAKILKKTNQQLQKDKEKAKIYTQTLVGEKRYSIRSKENWPQKRQNSIQIMKNQTKSIISLNENKKDQKQIFCLRKPKIYHHYTYKGGYKRQNELGPGCYNVNLNTINPKIKNQNFQFFNSTEVRFKQLPISLTEYHYQIQTSPKKQTPVQSAKKRSMQPKFQQIIAQKLVLPGPGQYNPQQKLTKRALNAHYIGKQKRFEDLTNKQQIENERQKKQIVNVSTLKSISHAIMKQKLKKSKCKRVILSKNNQQQDQKKKIIINSMKQQDQINNNNNKKNYKGTILKSSNRKNRKNIQNDFDISSWDKHQDNKINDKFYISNSIKKSNFSALISISTPI